MKVYDYLMNISVIESGLPGIIPMLDSENSVRENRMKLFNQVKQFAADRNAEVLPGNKNCVVIITENAMHHKLLGLSGNFTMHSISKYGPILLSSANSVDKLFNQYNHVLMTSELIGDQSSYSLDNQSFADAFTKSLNELKQMQNQTSQSF